MTRRPQISPLFPHTPLSRPPHGSINFVDFQLTSYGNRRTLRTDTFHTLNGVASCRPVCRFRLALKITFLREQVGAGACRDSSSDRKSTRLNSSHLVISYAVF